MTALAWAAYQDYEQVVDVLLKAGANPDILCHVCSCQCSCIIIYTAHNIIIQEGLTILMVATHRGHIDIVKALLRRKVNPNVTDRVSW